MKLMPFVRNAVFFAVGSDEIEYAISRHFALAQMNKTRVGND